MRRCWWATAVVSTPPCCCIGCGAARKLPARRCARCTCTTGCSPMQMTGCGTASSNATPGASNWPCTACRSRTAQAWAPRVPRDWHDAPRSRPNCATAKPWRWHSTRTTRPRPSCCAPCALPASMAWQRCPRTAALAKSLYGDRCWQCHAVHSSTTPASMHCTGSKTPATPTTTPIATSCACRYCHCCASAGRMPLRRWRAAQRTAGRPANCLTRKTPS